MRRLLAVLLFALVPLVAACGGDSSSGSTAKTTTTAAPQTTASAPQTANGCEKVAEPKPKGDVQAKKPTFKVKPGVTYTAVLETTCGTIEIKLASKQAPKTAASFVSLVRQGFYDGLVFHRIIAGFVAQGGDPQGTGEGGPGYSVTEAPPQDLQYTPGVVAMAKTQTEAPGTSGSQFFIVTGDQGASLTPDYALVGRVTKGKDVVARLDKVPSDPAAGDRPTEPVVIKKATIRES